MVSQEWSARVDEHVRTCLKTTTLTLFVTGLEHEVDHDMGVWLLDQ